MSERAGEGAGPAAHERPRASSRAARLRLGAAALAAGLALLSGVLGVRLAQRYYAVAPYHYDSAAHRWRAVALFRQAEQLGTWPVLAQRLRAPDPLGPALRLILFRRALLLRFGHLWVALPALALFLFLLIDFVAERTGSLLRGLAVAAFLLSFPLVYEPTWGLADNLSENGAAWLLGATLLAFVRSRGFERRGFGLLCGLLFGSLVLYRAVAAVYAAALLLPPAFVAALRRLRREARRPVQGDLAAAALPALLLGGAAVALQGSSVYTHYFVIGYGYGTAAGVARYLVGLVRERLGFAPLWILCALALGAIPLRRARVAWRARGEAWTAAGWLLGLPLLVVAGGTFYWGLPALWTAPWLVLLAVSAPARAPRPGLDRLAVAWLLLAAIGACVQYDVSADHVRAAGDPRGLRPLFAKVAASIPRGPGPSRVKILVDELDELFLNQAFFDEGRRGIGKGYGLVSIHDSYFNVHYAGWPPEKIARENLRLLEHDGQPPASRTSPGPRPDLWALAYCTPEEVRFTPSFEADGRHVARPATEALNRLVRDNPAWKRVWRGEHKLYDCVELLHYDPPPAAP